MKTLLATLVTVIIGVVALPDTAEARPHRSNHSNYTYRSGNASCGCPVYTKRLFAGYDHYRQPIFRYHSVPIVHRCRSNYNPHYRGQSRHHRYSNYYSYGSRYNSYNRYNRQRSFHTRYGNVGFCR